MCLHEPYKSVWLKFVWYILLRKCKYHKEQHRNTSASTEICLEGRKEARNVFSVEDKTVT
jgi:hypothetical protein